MSTEFGFPRDFFCEHGAEGSRVLALVSHDGFAPSLHAVLTCDDRLLAHRAASVLAEAARGGRGDVLDAEARRVAEALPRVPGSSFRQALDRVYGAHWPISGAAAVPWDEVDRSPVPRDSEAHTPAGARLAELSGPVFRLTNLLEIHVHDVPRLLAAAAADGWVPPEGGQEPDSLDNLLDAAMHLADLHEVVPGAEVVTAMGVGEHLDPDAGDEVADWSDKPVEASFEGGALLRVRGPLG
ncbi:hypothetical protein [Saccharothrix obliqua]|uniref:hypothetical protein n=1 Tax=Saccharothrix obliqua TaxID=2861747 RepID=UPI001C5D7849|nr:hypothetical protein [Saccharothrix obliqua]MBW4716370.1 hypothetical protein [Saccharothrix obliqua]